MSIRHAVLRFFKCNGLALSACFCVKEEFYEIMVHNVIHENFEGQS